MSEERPTSETGAQAGRRRWGERRLFRCHACGQTRPFCWNCPCGFEICDDCLRENSWGMSSVVVWICPDCGRVRGF